MRNVIILMAFFGFLYGCSDKAATAAPFELAGFELEDIPGSDMKRAVLKNEKGKVLEDGTLKSGKRHGAWTVYHTERDSPKTIANYVDGVLNGAFFELAPYGQIAYSCSYSNNKLHGHFIKYKGIRKSEEGYYLDGKLEGIYKKYYEGRDLVQQELMYREDKLEGETLFYNEQGEVTMRYNYKNGEKVGGGIVASDQ